MPFSGVEAWAENDRMHAAEFRRQCSEVDEHIHSLAIYAQELEEQHRPNEADAVYRKIERLQAALRAEEAAPR